MTALARALVERGFFHNETLADAAITSGQVYRDGNGDVRCAGKSGVISAPTVKGTEAASGKDSLTKREDNPGREKFPH